MSRPKSYRKQTGCISCKHCWSKWNPEYRELFCAKGVTKIPVGYYYPHDEYEDKRIYCAEKGHDDEEGFWVVDNWEREHSVDEWGICDFYEKKE
jgi:hypothetical protein